ncbi:hypothetical protein IscW_ISCW012097 [Ixodes scapularis]|uniref:Uncharacterized protein n=1 Tax=Ixodes scapularis TaxID=6945 RepID=B7QAU0_IXOSC|nr:hypothetical protein IscW_ISCW012097 [Ixodes scapularis]|eukprot:XP_002412666.1 hypothetical protein IscW_ISCW012097 [Ixodes scapularis]
MDDARLITPERERTRKSTTGRNTADEPHRGRGDSAAPLIAEELPRGSPGRPRAFRCSGETFELEGAVTTQQHSVTGLLLAFT